LVYSNLKTGEKREFDASSKVYLDSKIWEKTKEKNTTTIIDNSTKEVFSFNEFG